MLNIPSSSYLHFGALLINWSTVRLAVWGWVRRVVPSDLEPLSNLLDVDDQTVEGNRGLRSLHARA